MKAFLWSEVYSREQEVLAQSFELVADLTDRLKTHLNEKYILTEQIPAAIAEERALFLASRIRVTSPFVEEWIRAVYPASITQKIVCGYKTVERHLSTEPRGAPSESILIYWGPCEARFGFTLLPNIAKRLEFKLKKSFRICIPFFQKDVEMSGDLVFRMLDEFRDLSSTLEIVSCLPVQGVVLLPYRWGLAEEENLISRVFETKLPVVVGYNRDFADRIERVLLSGGVCLSSDFKRRVEVSEDISFEDPKIFVEKNERVGADLSRERLPELTSFLTANKLELF